MKPQPAYRRLNLFTPQTTGFVSSITDRLDRLSARIDLGQMRYRHRLGAWEATASFGAAKLRENGSTGAIMQEKQVSENG